MTVQGSGSLFLHRRWCQKNMNHKNNFKNIYKRFGEHVNGTIMERLPPEA
jgi:hypothetical protein